MTEDDLQKQFNSALFQQFCSNIKHIYCVQNKNTGKIILQAFNIDTAKSEMKRLNLGEEFILIDETGQEIK